eukprot:TRINITY_DN16370_c0_g1_i2.p1 TRINITY_DN16370_c0_g1~~TRINITY_DN16370_c0_g1_i2.p1  ORF type:complete len:1129 (+),score=310.78 TRINITY_DN16370_c0_g1_i2:65-3451(+)
MSDTATTAAASSSGRPLASSSGCHQGWLQKESRWLKQWRRRFVTLSKEDFVLRTYTADPRPRASASESLAAELSQDDKANQLSAIISEEVVMRGGRYWLPPETELRLLKPSVDGNASRSSSSSAVASPEQPQHLGKTPSKSGGLLFCVSTAPPDQRTLRFLAETPEDLNLWIQAFVAAAAGGVCPDTPTMTSMYSSSSSCVVTGRRRKRALQCLRALRSRGSQGDAEPRDLQQDPPAPTQESESSETTPSSDATSTKGKGKGAPPPPAGKAPPPGKGGGKSGKGGKAGKSGPGKTQATLPLGRRLSISSTQIEAEAFRRLCDENGLSTTPCSRQRLGKDADERPRARSPSLLLEESSSSAVPVVDLAALRTAFAAPKASAKSIVRRNSSAGACLRRRVELLPNDTAQMLAIVLAKCKVETEKLAEALQTMDPQRCVISSEDTMRLLEMWPSQEVLQRLTEYLENGGDTTELRDVEKQLAPLVVLPRIRVSLRIMAIANTLEERYGEAVFEKLRLLQLSCAELRASTILRDFLAIVVVLFNYVNFGLETTETSKNGMRGVDVQSLLRLQETKAYNGDFPGFHMLHFVLKQLLQKRPKLRPNDFEAELPSLAAAAAVSLDAIKQELGQLRSDQSFVQDELKLQRQEQEEKERLATPQLDATEAEAEKLALSERESQLPTDCPESRMSDFQPTGTNTPSGTETEAQQKEPPAPIGHATAQTPVKEHEPKAEVVDALTPAPVSQRGNQRRRRSWVSNLLRSFAGKQRGDSSGQTIYDVMAAESPGGRLFTPADERALLHSFCRSQDDEAAAGPDPSSSSPTGEASEEEQARLLGELRKQLAEALQPAEPRRKVAAAAGEDGPLGIHRCSRRPSQVHAQARAMNAASDQACRLDLSAVVQGAAESQASLMGSGHRSRARSSSVPGPAGSCQESASSSYVHAVMSARSERDKCSRVPSTSSRGFSRGGRHPSIRSDSCDSQPSSAAASVGACSPAGEGDADAKEVDVKEELEDTCTGRLGKLGGSIDDRLQRLSLAVAAAEEDCRDLLVFFGLDLAPAASTTGSELAKQSAQLLGSLSEFMRQVRTAWDEVEKPHPVPRFAKRRACSAARRSFAICSRMPSGGSNIKLSTEHSC